MSINMAAIRKTFSMPQDTFIRAYRPSDCPALVEITYDAVAAISTDLYDDVQKRAWLPESPDLPAFEARFERAPPWVCVVADKPCGYLTLENDGHVDMLYVSPGGQGKGYAKALLEHALGEAKRLGRVFVEASHAARPFFERHGFQVVRENRIERSGAALSNWIMERRLVPWEKPHRIFIFGNSGSGKTTLGKTLSKKLGRSHFDLDTVAFTDQKGTRRSVAESLEMLQARIDQEPLVISGCYADLVRAFATERDHLVWLDLPVGKCVAHAKQRPWEPHKWPSQEFEDRDAVS